jgi:hypothetical protein
MTELEMKEAEELIRSFVARVEKGDIRATPDYRKACRLLKKSPLDEELLTNIRIKYIHAVI